jgi:bla regulator protein blaR1
MTDWLLDTILVTTLILAAVLILRKPVANIFGPNVAYFLWLLPAARLAMPSITVEKTASVSDTSQLVRDSVIGAVTSPQPSAFVHTIVPQATFDYGMVALSIWLGGAALLFVVQMARYVAMRDELLSDAKELGVTQGIKLIQSDRVSGPLAFGLFQRYIAVPDNFAVLFSSEERELAMQHEIAHHVSGDLVANLIAFIALCLMWFNPLAWISWRAFRFDQEAACDARVIAGKAPEMRQVYGKALARSAQEGLPTFATALNSPKTIIERLRRLTMKDASKQRRLLGKLGVFTAVGVILPLTATTVTVAAKDGVTVIRTGDKGDQKVKVIKMTRVKDADVDSSGNVDAPYVQTITRNGRTIVLRTNYKLSQQEIDKMADEAEASRVEADDVIGEAETARRDADTARADAETADADAAAERADAEASRSEAEIEGMAHAHAMAHVDSKYIASLIPEIRISEVTHNCKDGQPVTTNVSGMDGKNNSRVQIVMCGKGQARIARAAAVEGLKEALSDIRSEEDMPDSVRKQVIASLRQQIRQMQNQRD